MPKDVIPSLTPRSRFPSTPVTVAVEYKQPSVHQSSSLPDKIIQDFAYLRLPRPSPTDIHESIGDWVEVHLNCMPFGLERLRTFELSQEKAVADLKDHCGIKRMWRLTRFPYRPTANVGLKRQIANIDTNTDVTEKKRKRLEPDLHLKIIIPSESDLTPSPPVTSSQDTPLSLMKFQERIALTDSPMHAGPPERPQNHVEVIRKCREQETIDDVVLLRMLPLDQSELPNCADVEDNPVEEPSAQTRDPRRPGLNCCASPGWSTGSQEEDGYPTGTRLLPVDTSEKHRSGCQTKLRRLFQREQRRQAELRAPIELEREDARRRIESLESELQESKNLIREIGTELKTYKVRNMDLEARIQDLRRECEHPFVVPSLIDAFLKMRDLGLAVMQD